MDFPPDEDEEAERRSPRECPEDVDENRVTPTAGGESEENHVTPTNTGGEPEETEENHVAPNTGTTSAGPRHASLIRHVGVSHKSVNLNIKFKCALCDYTHANKRSTSLHFRHAHGVAIPPATIDGSKEKACPFCPLTFPSSHSCSTHIREKHMTEACQQRSREAAQKEAQQGVNSPYKVDPARDRTFQGRARKVRAWIQHQTGQGDRDQVYRADGTARSSATTRSPSSQPQVGHTPPGPSNTQGHRTAGPRALTVPTVNRRRGALPAFPHIATIITTRCSSCRATAAYQVPNIYHPTPGCGLRKAALQSWGGMHCSPGMGGACQPQPPPATIPPAPAITPPPAPVTVRKPYIQRGGTSVTTLHLPVPPTRPAIRPGCPTYIHDDTTTGSGATIPERRLQTPPPSHATISTSTRLTADCGLRKATLQPGGGRGHQPAATYVASCGRDQPANTTVVTWPTTTSGRVPGPPATITIDPERMDETLRMPMYQELTPFSGRRLGTFEWVAFEEVLKRWSTAIKEVVTAQRRRPPNPTSQWARRQQGRGNRSGAAATLPTDLPPPGPGQPDSQMGITTAGIGATEHQA
eukprot:Em0007g1022a